MTNREPYVRSKFTRYMTRDDINFAYLPIYRSGSTWTKAYLFDNGFHDVLRGAVSNKRKLVILREPLERIISGMIMRGFDFTKLLKNRTDLIDSITGDAHTNQQIYFLGKVDETHDFIKFGPNLPEQLKQYSLDHGLDLTVDSGISWIQQPPNLVRNNAPLSPNQLIEYIHSNDSLLKKFQNYLKDDYELYNKVTWYESN